MSDLLSASSLLMAIAAILFSLWYAEISKALEIIPKKFSVDNVLGLQIVKGIFYSKALPVTVMTILVAAIFFPDALTLCCESVEIYRSSTKLHSSYDAVRTAYCLVSLLSVVLAGYMLTLTVKLYKHMRRLR